MRDDRKKCKRRQHPDNYPGWDFWNDRWDSQWILIFFSGWPVLGCLATSYADKWDNAGDPESFPGRTRQLLRYGNTPRCASGGGGIPQQKLREGGLVGAVRVVAQMMCKSVHVEGVCHVRLVDLLDARVDGDWRRSADKVVILGDEMQARLCHLWQRRQSPSLHQEQVVLNQRSLTMPPPPFERCNHSPFSPSPSSLQQILTDGSEWDA